MEPSRVRKDNLQSALGQTLIKPDRVSYWQIHRSKRQHRNRIPPHKRRFQGPLRLHLPIRRDSSQASAGCGRKHPI
jgi:hypothetical protein